MNASEVGEDPNHRKDQNWTWHSIGLQKPSKVMKPWDSFESFIWKI